MMVRSGRSRSSDLGVQHHRNAHQVSREGFYAWQARPSAPRARADHRLGLEIAAIHAESRQRYGSPRIHAELAARGCRTSRKRVARLMRVRGLAARRRRRFRVTTHSRHPFPIAPNVLARRFERAAPDQAWVTDITYIPTGEGWLYLAVILDLYEIGASPRVCKRFRSVPMLIKTIHISELLAGGRLHRGGPDTAELYRPDGHGNAHSCPREPCP